MTARDLITRALVLTGAMAPGETLSASLADQARAVLSDLVDEWATDRLLLYTQARTVHALVAGQQDYTLGTGGDFDQARPVYVDAITVVDPTASPVFEFPPLRAYSNEDWASLGLKALTSALPEGYALDAGLPLMTVSLYPVPTTTTYQVAIYTPGGMLTSVPTLDTVISVPPGLSRALRYALASELSMIPGLAQAPRGDLAKVAAMSLARFQSQQVVPTTVAVDDALLGGGGGYNWRTGS